MRALIAAVLTAFALTACTAPADDPTAVQPAESGQPSDTKPAAKKPTPVKLVAVKTKPKASVLSTGMPLSCVKVTVTNQTSKQLEVNPLYFSITDTTGEKHDTGDTLAEYEDQIDTTELAPKEKVTGVVCGKGKWTPKQVAMSDPGFDEAARAEAG